MTTETSSNVTDDQDSTIGNIIQKEKLIRLSTPLRKWTRKKGVTTETSSNVTDDQDSTLRNIIQKGRSKSIVYSFEKMDHKSKSIVYSFEKIDKKEIG